MKRKDDERIAGWIMRDNTPVAVLTNYAIDIVQDKLRRRRRVYVRGLKDLKGWCDGVLLTTVNKLANSDAPVTMVLYFDSDRICVFGPAWLDCTTRRKSRFEASFCAAGSWRVTDSQ